MTTIDSDRSMSRDARVAFEAQILASYFPFFEWYEWDGELFAEGPMRTNDGAVFGVRVVLPDDYPSGIPQVLVTHPKPLRDAYGEKLTDLGDCASMHVLRPIDGLPVICHYPAWTWGPHRTVYQVVVKARLWLEAYQQHLRHGRPIDTWLGHAPA